MKVSRNFLKRLIRESIKKQTKDLTTQPGADISSEIESDFGGGQKDIVSADDFSDAQPVQTSRRTFMKLMATIAAALGVGGGVMMSKGSSSIALTDDELFQRAGFTKGKDPYVYSRHEYVYIQRKEIMKNTFVTIIVRPPIEGDAYSSEISVDWDPVDNIENIYVYGEEKSAEDILQWIQSKGLNEMLDKYMEALEEKMKLASEALRRKKEVYEGCTKFDPYGPNTWEIVDDDTGGLWYWWEHFVEVFGVPDRFHCAENDHEPWYYLLEAGMTARRRIDMSEIPDPLDGFDHGVRSALVGTFDGKKIVRFTSGENVDFIVYLADPNTAEGKEQINKVNKFRANAAALKQLQQEAFNAGIQRVDAYIEECKRGVHGYNYDTMLSVAGIKMAGVIGRSNYLPKDAREYILRTYSAKYSPSSTQDQSPLPSQVSEAIGKLSTDFQTYMMRRSAAIFKKQSEFVHAGKTYKVKTIQEEVNYINLNVEKLVHPRAR